MRDETIMAFLKNLNKGKSRNLIFKNSIGENVEYAKVWIWQRGKYTYKDQDFFLIKNGDGKYVSAIYGMNDFHWVTLYEERGKNYLSNALRNFVIPFLWGPNRQEIHEPFKVSINRGIGPRNFKSSLGLAKSIGFKVDNQNDFKIELLLSYDDFITKDVATPNLTPSLDSDTKIQLLEKSKIVNDLFLQIKGELEVRLGENKLEKFEKVLDLKRKLENIIDDYEFRKNEGRG
ncbi:hypothetical protein [Aquiflexum sp.]|uniref:hypothetical protein n=1 Tax=Aquiflexum sp. TaxID=1872584 RepID=UPI0035944E7D